MAFYEIFTGIGRIILLSSLLNGKFRHVLREVYASEPRISVNRTLPLVVTTWANEGFRQATDEAWSVIKSGGHRLDAVVAGCSSCERLQCDGTVGYGGSPDESGETTLDALILDGPGHRMGAVADLRGVKDAAKVARAVMEHTRHSMLAGESATKFALDMGFEYSDLRTNQSISVWKNWLGANCQPNYRQNVIPDPSKSCGPYRPSKMKKDGAASDNEAVKRANRWSHDTIGIVVIDANGDVAAGTSTNGAIQKIPGRVGDGPIPGAGAYVDNEVGGAAGTGDGDVMMRFLPSYQTVENMRRGMDPGSAAADAVRRIAKYYPEFKGAVIACNKGGDYGAACHGIGTFTYCVRNPSSGQLQTPTVPCVDHTFVDNSANFH